MVLFTKPSSLFFYILSSALLTLILAGVSYPQLKVELNFGEEDNFIAYENAPLDLGKGISFHNEFAPTGDFEISAVDATCPAGGPYLALNGINYFFKLPPRADINLNGHVAYSVSAWIYLYSTGVGGEIINADNGLISGYRFYIEDNVPKLEIRESGKETFSSEFTLKPSHWAHIGFFCDGSADSVVFFVNGQTVNKLNFTRVTQTNTGANSYIGAAIQSSPPNFLKANLDQLRFFAGRDTIFETVRSTLSKTNRTYFKRSRSLPPANFTLSQNYPNPFNLSTTVSFELKTSGYVELGIFDLLGNTIRTLYQGDKSAGMYEYSWDGTDTNASIVPSGIYFVRLAFNGIVQTKKMVLVK
jgi:hypothetical protein